jgi:hypothetical protein
MKRTFVVAVVLCLAATAALAIGAAPALAASGCACHTAVPPTGGAPAAHAPFVVGVDCTTCHPDWTVPHPDAEQTSLYFWPRTSATGLKLTGSVGVVKWGPPALVYLRIGHPDVVVYLQQKLWGATEFTDLTQVTTGGKGGFSFIVASPPRFAVYRAIAEGHVGPLVGGGTALFEPVYDQHFMTPKLTLKLQGVKNGIVKLGNSLTATGTVEPADIGAKVKIRVQKRVAGKWVTQIVVQRALSATGTCGYKFTPRHLGLYRVWFRTESVYEGDAEDDALVWSHARSPERQFRVQ